MAPDAGGSADQLDQSISRHHRIGCGARVTSGTGAVELARSNASKPDAWAFFTPYWPVAVPHGFWVQMKSSPAGTIAAAREEVPTFELHTAPVSSFIALASAKRGKMPPNGK